MPHIILLAFLILQIVSYIITVMKYSILLTPPVAKWFCARTSRLEVLGSILNRTCRPSHTEFSVVFSETRVNTG